MKSGLAFPSGFAGVGLLLLRASVAASLLLFAAAAGTQGWQQALGILFAVGICAGLQTRALAGLSIAGPLYGLLAGSAPPMLAALHLMNAAALMLIGAGAYSIDARLFGRRTITLPNRDDSIE